MEKNNPNPENKKKDPPIGGPHPSQSPGAGILDMLGGFMKNLEGVGDTPSQKAAPQKVVESQITGKSFHYWQKLRNLRQLRLCYCSRLHDRELKEIKNLSALEQIDFSGSSITGECFKYAKDLPLLREVLLVDCRQLTDKGLRYLGQIESLEKIVISGALISGSCFKEWKDLKNLKELRVTGCRKLTDKNLRYLDQCSNLEILDISATL